VGNLSSWLLKNSFSLWKNPILFKFMPFILW
jgi:hypothetical protein